MTRASSLGARSTAATWVLWAAARHQQSDSGQQPPFPGRAVAGRRPPFPVGSGFARSKTVTSTCWGSSTLARGAYQFDRELSTVELSMGALLRNLCEVLRSCSGLQQVNGVELHR